MQLASSTHATSQGSVAFSNFMKLTLISEVLTVRLVRCKLMWIFKDLTMKMKTVVLPQL